MDQNSTNGSGTEKRNWRERLGIGSGEMPKIADEFKKAAAAPQPSPRPVGAKAQQPVTKLAPMAPRAAVVRAPAGNGQPAPVNDVLADKLKAQRAAAEKLAAQRVSQAKERAEARVQQETAPPPVARPERGPEPDQASGRQAPQRPKFSFADDNNAPPRPGSRPGSLLPPRPALGGDRSAPPFVRQTQPPPFQPGYRPEGGGYRPPPAAAGYGGFSGRQPPPGSYRPPAEERGYAQQPVPRRTALDAPRQPAPEAYQDYDDYGDDPRTEPRFGRGSGTRARGRDYEDENNDLFEDELPPQRRRASASDYRSAYSEEEGYEDDRRRSNGPWLLLLLMLVAGALGFGVFWYYNAKMKPATASNQTQGETVPVVEAPEDPAKSSASDQAADGQAESATAKKKQIYDRIVGDREVTGENLSPTEEQPVAPKADGAASEEDSATGIPEPTGSAVDDINGTSTEEGSPLPIPPPPGEGEQGSLDQQGVEKMAAAAAQDSSAQVATPSAVEAKPKAKVATQPSVMPDADEIESTDEPAAVTTKKKAVATAEQTKTEDQTASLGSEPVVLVEPGEAISPSQSGTTGTPTLTQDDAAVPQQQATTQQPKKKKTLLDLFNRNSSAEQTTTASAAPAETLPAETQVAAIPEQPVEQTTTTTTVPSTTTKPSTATSGAKGYIVQIASLRSQSEAQSEFDRLQSSYGNIIGNLSPQITQATVSGSTRYRLGLGPLTTRDQAAKICNSLIAAGERDCIVRLQQ